MQYPTTQTKAKTLQIIKYFLIYSFGITWIFWFGIILTNHFFGTLWYGEALTLIPYSIGSLGPAISSFIVYRQFKPDFGVSNFFGFVFGSGITKVSLYIFGLLAIWRFFMIWVGFGISKPVTLFFVFGMLVNFAFAIIFGGLEELGWRGILQPYLEKSIGLFPSVFASGIIWSLWHLPLWLMIGTTQSQLSFGLYLISGIILSSSFTILYKYTKNLSLCILSHAWFNACIGLALYTNSYGKLEINLNWKVFVVFGLELIASVILGMVYKPKATNY